MCPLRRRIVEKERDRFVELIYTTHICTNVNPSPPPFFCYYMRSIIEETKKLVK